jgi:hypothetical protein
MKITHVLATAAISALLLAACQPAATDTAATSEEVAATTEPATTETPAALPCGILAQRDWTAQGTATTLTVAGKIDLPRTGYGVSLARTETAGVLALELRPPAAGGDAVTEHAVNYFGPVTDGGDMRSVEITCDGAHVTNVDVTH